jgi:pimeloyl-ACP methyl ester carboxylesterase
MQLKLRQANIFYETWGQGEPVILLHGGFGSNQDFKGQIPALAKTFRVIGFERPGHGHTADTNEPFTFPLMTNYTIDFIEALKLAPANIVGWSDGAIIALFLALSRPDLVKTIVSIGGNFALSGLSKAFLDWLGSATPESFKKVDTAGVELYEKISPDGPEHFPIVFEKTKKLWLEQPRISTKDLEKISAPTLVMVGDKEMISLEHTLELYRSINNAELCIVPGTTHFLLSEKPRTTSAIILEFLTTSAKNL